MKINKTVSSVMWLLAIMAMTAVIVGCVGPQKVSVQEVKKQQMPVAYVVEAHAAALYKETITPAISGMVLEYKVKTGDEVTAGQVVAILDSTNLQTQLATLEQQLAQGGTAAQPLAPTADMAHAQELLSAGIITQKEYQTLLARSGASTSGGGGTDTSGIEAAIAQIKANLEQTQIKATISGKVSAIYNEDRKIAIEGRPFMVIQQMSPVVASFTLPADLAENLTPTEWSKTPVFLRKEETEKGGELTYVETLLEGKDSVLAKAIFPNDGSLVPGEFYPVAIESDRLVESLVVPTESIRKTKEGAFLYVVTASSTVDVRPVVAGSTKDGVTVVTGSVQAGDKVIVDKGEFTFGQKVSL